MRRGLSRAHDGQRAVLFFAQNQLFVFLPALGIERQSIQPGILLRGHTLRAVKLQLFAASEERAAADLRHAGGNFHTLERRALGKAARPQLRHARLNAHPLHLAALGEGQRAHALHAAGDDQRPQMGAAGKRHFADLPEAFGQDDAAQGGASLKRARRDGHHRAGSRLKLNIQIVCLPVDAAHGGQRAVAVIGKIHHVPPHHRTGG